MYFKFPCEHCGKNLKVSEENVGRRARCPYCHKSITVPQVSAADIPVATPRHKKAAEKSAADAIGAVSEWADGTNVPLMPSALIGIGLTIVFYLVCFPFRKTYFGELFIKYDTGAWVPYALVFLMGWSAGILYLKSRKLRRQKDSMLFDVLPTELSEDIDPANLDKFIEHVRTLPAKPSESFLINRVLRGLEHFRVRKSQPEVVQMLSSQSEIDANAVESSYTIIKVFIWAIPILGFIGTVVGISAAVKGFSGSMDQAANIEVLKTSLNNVTGGLATAFDTTLVALVMSLLVSFPASSMQKSEEDLLNWVDEYCNENLLKRLDDKSIDASQATMGIDPQAIRHAMEQALAAHQAELESWKKRLETIGQTLTTQVADGWAKINEGITEQQHQRLMKIQEVAEMMSGDQNLGHLAEEVRDSINSLRDQNQQVHGEVADSMRQTAESLKSQFSSLTEGLAALNEVLGQLGEKQIHIEMHEPSRRSWLFGRRNGG